jgi:hypothetical protein
MTFSSPVASFSASSASLLGQEARRDQGRRQPDRVERDPQDDLARIPAHPVRTLAIAGAAHHA